MDIGDAGFSVRAAARQVGRSEATVRAWIKSGKVALVSSDPVRLADDDVLALRAQHLAAFDKVADLQLGPGELGQGAYEAEVHRLRELLRSVLASVESFGEGMTQLRRSQQIVLDALLPELSDLQPPPG